MPLGHLFKSRDRRRDGYELAHTNILDPIGILTSNFCTSLPSPGAQ
jgi:hypothetical protein